MISIKSEKEIELMRNAANILKCILSEIEINLKAGITTSYLDDIAGKVLKDNNATASFKGVESMDSRGKAFKHNICVSVNDEIIHGIPSSRILKNGDVVSIDLRCL